MTGRSCLTTACTRRVVYQDLAPKVQDAFSCYFCDKFCQPKSKPDVVPS